MIKFFTNIKKIVRKASKKELLFLLFFTVLSIIIKGYEYGLGNQIHYLTYLNYFLNPTLYPYDYLLKTHTLPYTIFIVFLQFIPTIAKFPQFTIFIVYSVFLYFYYFSIYNITKKLFSSTTLAWCTLIFFLFPIPIGGSTIYTVENSLIPRFIADVFLLLSINLLFSKRTIVSGMLAGIGFLFHPLTILVYPMILALLWILRYIPLRKMLYGFLFFLIIILPLISKFLTQELYTSPWLDNTWKSIIIERMPYVFVLKWSFFDLLLIVFIPIFIFLAYKYARVAPKIHPIILATVITSLGFFMYSVVSDLLSYRLGIQLQLGRNLYLSIIFIIMLLVKMVFRYKKIFYCTLVGLFIGATVFYLPVRLTDGIFWYRPLTDFEKTAVWSEQHTPLTSIFLVPPDSSGFRFWSKRSVIMENKEGGDALYARPFGIAWDSREDLIGQGPLTQSKIVILEHAFEMNYIVSMQLLPYPISFQSGNWKVYHIPIGAKRS